LAGQHRHIFACIKGALGLEKGFTLLNTSRGQIRN